MKKVMLVFGTRPDAIKMCPLVNELKNRREIRTVVCISGQHREMLEEVLNIFGVKPDYDLNIMQKDQTLCDITVRVLKGVEAVLTREEPDMVLVHGDTTTAFAASLASFYRNIPVGHVESGLRSYNILEPFPEEYNRKSISLISSYDFAPTENAKYNLIREGKKEENIFVTGNTVSDALHATIKKDFSHPLLDHCSGKRLLVLTAHRRENTGETMREIFRAIKAITSEFEDVFVLYPVHPNPLIKSIAYGELGGCDRVCLSEPLDTVTFHNILNRSYMIITDSGGIQEEATLLGKPTVVLRDRTERPEGVESGNLAISGVDRQGVYEAVKRVLTDGKLYKKMSRKSEIYGFGDASVKISDCITKILGG